MTDATALIPIERIASAILHLRGQKVMLDSDLANLYGVETKALNQAVKRNLDRFPEDFMFQLTWEEAEAARSQIVTLNAEGTGTPSRGGNVKYRPYAFTEQGVAMLSSVLRSPRAVNVNIGIMRAFVRLRQVLATNEELAARMSGLEARMDASEERTLLVAEVVQQILAVVEGPIPPDRRIGYRRPEDGEKGEE